MHHSAPECIEKSHISGRRRCGAERGRACGGRGRACGGRGRACPVGLRVAALATQRRLSLGVGSGCSLRKPTLATAWSPRPHLWPVGEEGKQSVAMRRSRGAGDLASSWVPGAVTPCLYASLRALNASGSRAFRAEDDAAGSEVGPAGARALSSTYRRHRAWGLGAGWPRGSGLCTGWRIRRGRCRHRSADRGSSDRCGLARATARADDVDICTGGICRVGQHDDGCRFPPISSQIYNYGGDIAFDQTLDAGCKR
jgi:hypothetical protein